MDYIYMWDGFYYEYTSFQVYPYEVRIGEYEDLRAAYNNRASCLANLIDYIHLYENSEIKDGYLYMINNTFGRLDFLNNGIP